MSDQADSAHPYFTLLGHWRGVNSARSLFGTVIVAENDLVFMGPSLGKRTTLGAGMRGSWRHWSEPRRFLRKWVESITWEGMDHEAKSVHGQADHRDPAGAGSWRGNGRCLPQTRISSATFYKWKAKYGGLEVSDAKRLRALEDENARLKKLLAEAMLDNAMLKDVASKKNGDARRKARGRRSSAARVRGERTAGLQGPGGRPQISALSRPTS
jgi:putative transposase